MSSKPPSGEDDPDTAAFLEAMADVAPVSKGRRSIPRQASSDTPGQQQRRLDAQGQHQDLADPNFLTLGEVPLRAPLEFLEWKQDGVQNAVFDKLKKAGYAVEANLDLHRKTVKQARQQVFEFLAGANARHQRCVLMSPGKGELSSTPGRLKSYVAHWLAEHPLVIAYCSAQRHHGGVGALYVLVKKSPASKEENRERYGLKDTPE